MYDTNMKKEKKTDIEIEELAGLAGYKSSSRCSICNAKHPISGVPVRGDIEDVFRRMGLKNCVAFARTMNVTVTERQFQRHFAEHAPYVRGEAWIARTRKFIKDAIEEHKEADDAIQTIINVGTKMVEGGEMPVTEKLYIEALKMQNRGKKALPLEGFIKEVEATVFDGEIIETPKLPEHV